MKVITNNKGLIVFYACLVFFAVFMSNMIDRNDDKMMAAKNNYIFSNN